MKWRNSDILEVRLKDESNRVIYKSKISSGDTRKLRIVFNSLQSLGVKIFETFASMVKEDKDKEDTGWFN